MILNLTFENKNMLSKYVKIVFKSIKRFRYLLYRYVLYSTKTDFIEITQLLKYEKKLD